MLQSFEVRGFKSLQEVRIDLGLVNVFIGANGSGKSNFLEAIGVLGAAAGGRVDDEALLRRGVRPGVPALYKSSFKHSRFPGSISFTAQGAGHAVYSAGLFNPLDRPEPSWRFKTESLWEGNTLLVGRSPRSLERLDPAAGLAALKAVELPDGAARTLMKDLREYAIYAPDTATLRGLEPDPQSRVPVGLSGGRIADAVQETFRARPAVYRETLDLIDWCQGLALSPSGSVPVSPSIPQPTRILRFRDQHMADGRNYLSAYDASEGALYVLFAAVLMHHAQSPRVFAIDNFDHALNPRLARALTRRICEWALATGDRQVLMTSHNPLVLDGLPLREDAVRLFTVERSSGGKTVISRVQVSEALLRQAEDGLPLSQQWVLGTLGGMPPI
jgi:energy-coupling factor transporter ATP-binding protein EcfA2